MNLLHSSKCQLADAESAITVHALSTRGCLWPACIQWFMLPIDLWDRYRTYMFMSQQHVCLLVSCGRRAASMRLWRS